MGVESLGRKDVLINRVISASQINSSNTLTSTVKEEEIPGLQQMSPKQVFIVETLNGLYPDPPIPLNHNSEFQLLCAIILSAQTTDAAVNKATAVLFSEAPDAQTMSQLSQLQLEEYIHGIGLYRNKAKNLLATAKLIVEMAGQVPHSIEELVKLPGVGNKTASVFMSQACGVPSFAVDTHVHRLALRWGLSKETKKVDQVSADLKGAFPENLWSRMHLQMIYFGREYCPAKKHLPAQCPICKAVNAGLFETLTAGDIALSFTQTKAAKNILSYADRKRELHASPKLIMESPKPKKVKREIDV